MAVAPVSTVPAPGPGAAPAPYAERRAELMRRIGPDGALVLASPPEHLRNGDTHFKFRQDSDILYLTGFEEPGAVVVIRPGHATMRFVLFVRPRDPARGDLDRAAGGRRGRRARLPRRRGVRSR
jgi:Xaa-Pro aminopeptidase